MTSPTTTIAEPLISSGNVKAVMATRRVGNVCPRVERACPASTHEPRIVTGTETSARRDGFGFLSSATTMIALNTHTARNAGNEISGAAMAKYRDGRTAQKTA